MTMAAKISAILISVLLFATSSNAIRIEPADVTAARPKNAAPFLTDVFSHRSEGRSKIDLNGPWELQRDPNRQGTGAGWHRGEGTFADKMNIPGAPQAQGFGESTPHRKNYFEGPFWVRRSFFLPAIGPNQRVWLRIGGVLPAAEIYLNGLFVGYTKSSRTQQRVDVTDFLKPGTENLIAVQVCDFPEVRLDGLWEMEELHTMWTGVYRPISLEITDRVSLVDVYIRPQIFSSSVLVNFELSCVPADAAELRLQVCDGDRIVGETRVPVSVGQVMGTATIQLGRYSPWSPENPQLYTLHLSLHQSSATDPLDRVAIRFGMRELLTLGKQFYLNGNPIFIRCYGEDQFYPDTVAPPPDVNWYLSRLKCARAYGMNAVKSCVEILSQDYLEAADEAGILVIQEMPFGLSGLRANRCTIDERFREYYSSEMDGLIRESRNNASVAAYSMSSEMDFGSQTQESFDFFSRDLIDQARKLAPHALLIDCTGYLYDEDTAKGKRKTDFYAHIMPAWMKEVLIEPPITTDGKHPVLLHEYNWWSCYPDPQMKSRYMETQFTPSWLDQLTRTALENGQGELLSIYRENSLWLQALCRKDGIEYARRNTDVEGYILWLLIDFGQYCEGLLNDFWEPKNVSPEEFLQSNGDTVILLAEEGNRCMQMGKELNIPLAISHYGLDDYQNLKLHWRFSGPGWNHEGDLNVPELKRGTLQQAGAADCRLPDDKKAYRFTLQTTLLNDGIPVNRNEWSFWAFPDIAPELSTLQDKRGEMIAEDVFAAFANEAKTAIPEVASLVITDSTEEQLATYLDKGGRCILLCSDVPIQNTAVYLPSLSFYRMFRTIPWNAGNSGNSGSIVTLHPALRDFPHDGRCDLQFVSMIRGVLPVEFSPLREYGVTPIIRMIDHYAANRNNAHIVEFRVGNGKVLVTTLGILPSLRDRIEARYLLHTLIGYARSEEFHPIASVPRDVFLKWFGPKANSDQTTK